MKRKGIVRVGIAGALLALSFWWLLRSVSLQSLVDAVAQANVWWVLLCVPVVMFSHVARAMRWRYLLPATTPVNLWDTTVAVLVGYASSVVIPRSGEVLRPLLLTRRTSVSSAITLSSIVLERMVDVATLLFGLCLVLLTHLDSLQRVLPGVSVTQLVVAATLPLVTLVLVVAVVGFSDWGRRRLPEFVSLRFPTFGSWLKQATNHFFEHIRSLNVRSALGIMVHTMTMWIAYVVPIWMILHAFPGLQNVSLVDACLVLVAISVGVTVAPTPGALGIYQVIAQQAIVVLTGASPAICLAAAMTIWCVTYGCVLIFGGILWLHESFRTKQPHNNA
jgi:glycosyltransferase 2 family protein